MHYDPRNRDHGLPRDPFTSLVVPRPIGWISTVSCAGVVNLAPYSYFNAITSRPPHVLFASNGRKDSQRNAEETGEFVANLATYELRAEVNLTSAEVDAEVSEPVLASLEMTPSVNVRPPRVTRCPVALECQYIKTVGVECENGETLANSIVIGRVVGIYIDDRVIENGRINLAAIRPIARLGYMDYAVIRHRRHRRKSFAVIDAFSECKFARQHRWTCRHGNVRGAQMPEVYRMRSSARFSPASSQPLWDHRPNCSRRAPFSST